ncbi:hypothetical protein ACRALDRAFT_2021724 [Sodiomyces alcalophilus JCM 7366]|uniref:uncharacterized protein n=1 Tax=Sodiomyces alcalophilus JCM 7366 TaxID=591952 RepID=UPI0039B521E7
MNPTHDDKREDHSNGWTSTWPCHLIEGQFATCALSSRDVPYLIWFLAMGREDRVGYIEGRADEF